MNQYKVSFESIPWEQPAAGVRFKAFEQDGRRLRLAEFTRDFAEADWCTKGHIGYVLDGQMEIDFHGPVVAFRAGDGLFIPAGHEHGHKARVLTESVTVVLVESV
jgi:ethanolamine utilization protein EutQ (cupin superfamily)